VLVVDTNVLIYAADLDSPYHVACNRWLDAQRRKPEAWYSTWPIVYEFLRVTTHTRVFRKPWTIALAWSFIKSLSAAPGFSLLGPTSRHADLLEHLLAEMPHLAGSILHDAHTVCLMREHGLRQIVTRDADFHRFKGVDVLDPVVPSPT
jgi:toxin-antitoxin system PIN domain toxin